MKQQFFLLFIICVFLFSCISRKIITKQNTFNYYFTLSKNTWNDKEQYGKWIVKNDTATITLGYFRGDCCGSVPNPENIYAKISNDTIYYDYRNIKRPNCDSKIGICGAVIDFVINIKKYPKYKKHIWKNIK